MSAKIIDGKKISEEILAEAKKEVSILKLKGVEPCLAVLLVGENPASLLYVEKKEAACSVVGIKSIKTVLDESVAEAVLLEKISELNNDASVHGILVQLPLPKHLNQEKILNAVLPQKDVDGFTAQNLGLLAQGKEELVSCTAKGIVKLIESTGKKIVGKNVCIVNHSVVVGKPLAFLLLNRNATVTVCHEFTSSLAKHTKQADILVSAVGKPGLIKVGMIKKGAIVVDAGISRKERSVLGDVEFEKAKKLASFITPVPGGVGPMTVACLMENTVLACKRQCGEIQ